MPADSQRGRAIARLTWKLAQFAEENGLGEVYAGEAGGALAKALGKPALSFISREHLATGRTTPRTPDLVVELASAQTADAVTGWLRHGARTALVIDLKAETVTLYRSGAASRTFGAEGILEIPDLLPGWSLHVGDLFQ
jgi:Uma2 family endonuclease